MFALKISRYFTTESQQTDHPHFSYPAVCNSLSWSNESQKRTWRQVGNIKKNNYHKFICRAEMLQGLQWSSKPKTTHIFSAVLSGLGSLCLERAKTGIPESTSHYEIQPHTLVFHLVGQTAEFPAYLEGVKCPVHLPPGSASWGEEPIPTASLHGKYFMLQNQSHKERQQTIFK